MKPPFTSATTPSEIMIRWDHRRERLVHIILCPAGDYSAAFVQDIVRTSEAAKPCYHTEASSKRGA